MAPGRSRKQRPPNAVVLVVDDDPDLRDLVRATLGGAGLEVHAVESGEQALAVVDSIGPGLVITDVLMPGLDGWSLVRALRSRPGTALTPVILMTALSGRGDRLRGFRLGADDYLPKPFEPAELVLRVQRVLASPPELDAEPEADLSGRLDQICLSSVLTLLDNDQKSGTLTVESPGRCGRIQINAGSVARAVIDDSADSVEAMYEVLQWSTGDFRFREHEVAVPAIGISTVAFLLEAARRADEASHGEDPLSALQR